MTLKHYLIISYIQTLLFAISATLSFVKFKSKHRIIILLGITFLLSVSADLASHIMIGLKINTNYAASIYSILVFPFISLIYFYSIRKKHKLTFIVLALLHTMFSIINLIFIQKSFINSYSFVVQSIVIILYSLYYFYWLTDELPTTKSYRLPMFWINSAYMIYSCGTLILFIFTPYLVHVLKDDLLIYWTMHNVIGIIEALIFILALCIDLKNLKPMNASLYNDVVNV